MYASIKGKIWGAIPLDSDATHLVLGFMVFFLAVALFRQPMARWSAFWPVLVVAVAVEVADMVLLGQGWVSAVRQGFLFCLLPLILVFATRQGWMR